MIIIVDTYERIIKENKHKMSEKDCLGLALAQSGLSITLTSVSSSLAFATSAIFSNILGIKWFCIVAGFAFLLNYELQFLVFVPLMVLDNRRIKANRNAICPCIKHESSNNEDNIPGNDDDDDEEEINRCSLKYILDKTLVKCLSYWYCRWIIIIIFAGLWVVSAFATLNIGIGIDQKSFFPGDSYIREYFVESNKAFVGSTVNEVVIVYNNQDISDRETRDNFMNMFNEYNNLSYAVGEVNEWVTSFITEYETASSNSIDNSSSSDVYDYLTNYFANDTSYKEWNNEIIYDNDVNPTRINYGKFYITALLPTAVNDIWPFQQQMERIVQENMNDYSDDTYVWHPYFLHAYVGDTIVRLVIENVLLTVATIAGVLILTLDFRQAIFISIMVLGINGVLLCWMYLLNINLDVITYIELVMSVGLTVDYVIHITHAIADAKPRNGSDYSERIKLAFHEMGASVFKGAFTTLLGVIALTLSSVEAFQIFMKMMFGVIISACIHGLILVPALLGELYCLYDRNDKIEYSLPAVQLDHSTTNTDVSDGRANSLYEV